MSDYRKSDNKKYKAFIFDCDGTVLNTNPAIFNAWRLTVASFNPDVKLADADISVYFGRSVPEACIGFLESCGKPGMDQDTDKIVEMYWKNHTAHPELVEEYPGLKAAITELKRRGAAVMMVTSGRHDIVLKELKYFGMENLFDAVIAQEDSPVLKPNPDPALLACKKAGVDPKDTLFVGDAPSDFACGNRAGNHTCCVPWTVCEKSEFTCDAVPDFYIQSADELVKLCAL